LYIVSFMQKSIGHLTGPPPSLQHGAFSSNWQARELFCCHDWQTVSEPYPLHGNEESRDKPTNKFSPHWNASTTHQICWLQISVPIRLQCCYWIACHAIKLQVFDMSSGATSWLIPLISLPNHTLYTPVEVAWTHFLYTWLCTGNNCMFTFLPQQQ